MRSTNGHRSTSSWKDVFEFFLLFKRSQGVSERTLDDYRDHIPRFFESTRADMSDSEALRMAVIKYFADSAALAPATYNTRRKELKSFFSWAVSEQIIESDPMAGIKTRKEDDVPRSVEEDVIRRLLALPDQRTFAGLRDYALLILTLDTGIRPKEALALRLRDFDFANLLVTIRAEIAKTRVTRVLPISAVTAHSIRRLLKVRHPEWPDDGPVFCNQDGQPLNRASWDRRLRNYSRTLGVTVRPYYLRHSFALYYLRHGGNAFGLQKTLGHTTMTMTRRYVSLTTEDLRDQHNVASPVKALVPQVHRLRNIGRKTVVQLEADQDGH